MPEAALTFVHPMDDWRSGTFWRVAGHDDAFPLIRLLMDLLLFEEHRLSCNTGSTIVIIFIRSSQPTSALTHVRPTLYDDLHALRHGSAIDVGGVTAIVAFKLLQRLLFLSHQRP